MHAALGLHARAKGCRRALKLLIGDQALNQDLAQGVAVECAELLEVIVILVIVVCLARGFLGHQRGGLDVQKGCRDQQKVARHVQVQRLDALDLGKVLLGHLADRDGADINFLAGYQLQQQVERSAVDLRRHTIRHLRPPLTAPSRRGLGACCDRYARSTCKFTLDAGDCEVEQPLSQRIHGNVEIAADHVDAGPHGQQIQHDDKDRHSVLLQTVVVGEGFAFEEGHDD